MISNTVSNFHDTYEDISLFPVRILTKVLIISLHNNNNEKLHSVGH